MKKSSKLYIDTSVWNFALETERADCLITQDFFSMLRNERSNYIVLISDLVEDEMNRASTTFLFPGTLSTLLKQKLLKVFT